MTARKTTPHLKRGPKPKPKQPKRAKGRPEVRLRDHPDRYTVARFDVADLWLRNMTKGKRLRAGFVQSMSMFQQGQSAANLRKAADRLRTIAKRYSNPDDMKWRRTIAKAVGQTMLGAAVGGEPEQGRISLIMEHAASVGETEWVRRELLPLTALRPPFEMEQRDQLTDISWLIVWVGWFTEINQWMAARGAGDDAQTVQPELAGIFCPT